jgi:hypothetical protein
MPLVLRGVMQPPVTPLREDFTYFVKLGTSIDLPLLAYNSPSNASPT